MQKFLRQVLAIVDWMVAEEKLYVHFAGQNSWFLDTVKNVNPFEFKQDRSGHLKIVDSHHALSCSCCFALAMYKN